MNTGESCDASIWAFLDNRAINNLKLIVKPLLSTSHHKYSETLASKLRHFTMPKCSIRLHERFQLCPRTKISELKPQQKPTFNCRLMQNRSAESFYTCIVVLPELFCITHIDYQDQLLLMIKQII